MNISFKPYRKENGEINISVDSDMGVSLLLTPAGISKPYVRMMRDEQKVYDQFYRAFWNHGRAVTEPVGSHPRLAQLGRISFLPTDMAASQGVLVFDNRALDCGTWYNIQ